MKSAPPLVLILLTSASAASSATDSSTYAVVDTGQDRCYSARGEIPFPAPGEAYRGQDAQYAGNGPSYRDEGDGTISDLVTGLEWQKSPDTTKYNQQEAELYARELELGGHDDWRLPTIKELFSLADLRGNMHTHTPYIDTTVFDFHYPESNQGSSGRPGQRNMDAQYASSTRYLGITMGRDESAFGFNFADGRIKSYPLRAKRYVRAVRGNPAYGVNRFEDPGDGTVRDEATGLVWMKNDSAETMDWKGALAFAEGLEFAGADDWRLPTVKELQSIVDYTRAPDASDPYHRSPAIDPAFELHEAESWAWSSTTHIENQGAYYVCFGQSFSVRERAGKQINAHGAGAVRSDPKEGNPADWPEGLGPQADEIRILNRVRCVRGGTAAPVAKGPEVQGPADGARERGGRRGERGGDFIERFDADGDGRVSRTEFDGRDRRFETLDVNRDGFVDSAEAPTGRPGAAGARQVSSEPGLAVVTVGTGSPLYDPERSDPCAMITLGDVRLLVDLGEGTHRHLQEQSIPLNGVVAFCFTHHHRDHNADAMSILPTAWSRGNAAPILGPEGTRDLVEFLSTFYAEDLDYRSGGRRRDTPAPPARPVVHELPLAKPLAIGGVTIRTTEVPHALTTFAYRFDAGEESIVVSGDLGYSEKLIELAAGASILVIDSGGIIYEGDPPGRSAPAKGVDGNLVRMPPWRRSRAWPPGPRCRSSS